MGPDADWDAGFVAGLAHALATFELPLLGGDTVAMAGARTLGLTALGWSGRAPSRAGAQQGGTLWVTGRIGAAGLGLAQLRANGAAAGEMIAAYRRPVPRVAWGRALAPLVDAMADVSDGLLIDAQRMAAASGLAATVALDRVPYAAGAEHDRLAAVTAGDDYELLFAASSGFVPPTGVRATAIGAFRAGAGLTLTDSGVAVPLPPRLGYEHAAGPSSA